MFSRCFKKNLALAAALPAALVAILGSGTAKAAACSDGTLSGLVNVSCTTAQGFTYKLTSFTGFAGTDTFSFTNGGADNFQYSLQGSSAYVTGSPYSLVYELTAPSGRLLDNFTTGGSTSVISSSATWVIAASPGPTASGTIAFSGQSNATATFSPQITFSTFTGTLNVASGNISSVTSLVASAAPVVGAPGPLPVLGAGAAFGFSRKLRKRIKQAA